MNDKPRDRVEIEELFELRNSLLQAPNLEDLLSAALHQALKLVHAQVATVYLYNKRGFLVRIQILERTSGDLRRSDDWYPAERVEPNKNFTGRVAVPRGTFGVPKVSNDLSEEQVNPESRSAFETKFGPLRCAIGVPLNGKFGTLGVLEVINKMYDSGNADPRPVFTDSDVYLLSMIAMNLATGISRYTLWREQRLISAISAMIVTGTHEDANPRQFYSTITTTLAGPNSNYIACILRVGSSPTELETVSHYGVDDNDGRLISWEGYPEKADFTNSPLSAVFTTLEPKIITNLDELKHQFHANNWIRDNDLRSYIALPLGLAGQVFGTLSLFTGYTYKFTDDNIVFLRSVASLAATYMELRRLMEEDERRRADLYTDTQRIVAGTEQIRLDQALDTERHRVKHFIDSVTRELTAILPDLSGRAIGVVSKQLDLLKTESETIVGKLDAVESRLNVNEVVSGVVRYFKNLLRGKPISIEFDKGAIPEIQASEAEIIEMVRNLISNSVRAIDMERRKRGQILVRTSIVKDRIPMIAIRIQDNGCGIRNEHRGMIFNRNFTKSGGTGMGLYISKALAKGYGGDVVLESATVGEGTSIEIRLPLVRLRTEGPGK